MPDDIKNTETQVPPHPEGSRSQLGLYRTYLTSPEHRRFITVGRSEMLEDTIKTLKGNIGKKPKHHQLFIAPRGSGKTHFLSLIEDEIDRDADLKAAYQVVRFPEEANRVCSFADFLLMICEILSSNNYNTPLNSSWKSLYDRLSVEEDDSIVCDTLTKAIRSEYQKSKQVLVLMVENLNQIMEEQIKKEKSIQALRGFLMGDNGCLLIATSPMHFGLLTNPNQPFYDFFDTQVLDLLNAKDTISLIRRNLEWDNRDDILNHFDDLRPKLRAIHTMTGGSPRLTVMLYELITTESIIAVKEQFLMLQDRITPFYQDRMRDLSPQERAVLETIASMRDKVGQPALAKTPGNIARLMRVSQQHISTLLQRLTKSLYLVANPNPQDARSSLYTIREGFFDLWLAMNISRASQQRIPFLSEFFTAFYTLDEPRQKKQSEHWQQLNTGEFNANAAESLSYLSTLGSPEEQASEKMKLFPLLHRAGDWQGSELLKTELSLLPLDTTGRWISDHLNYNNENYLDDIQELIHCWETKRQGGLEAFAQRLREMGGELNFKTWSALRIEFLTDQVETLPLSAEKVEIRLKLAGFLREQARWEETEKQAKAALEEAELLNNGNLISSSYSDYSLLLKATNRYTEAEVLLRNSLKIAESIYSDSHPITSIHLNNLGQLLMETNRLNEAEQLMRRSIMIEESSKDQDKYRLSNRLNNLANLLFSKNQITEAESLLRRSLKMTEEIADNDHPEIAIRLNNLAQLLLVKNQIDEAEALMQHALEIDEKNFGQNHPKVAIRLNNLAALYIRAGQTDLASSLLEKALNIDETCFGNDHPNISIELNNLAILYSNTNRLSEAIPLLHRALKILLDFYRKTGFSHPELYKITSNYINLLVAVKHTREEAIKKIAALFKQYEVLMPELE